MSFYKGLVPLRDVLADLLPSEGSARVVIAEAGFPEKLINFDGSAIEMWQNILSVSQGYGQVQDVIDAARRLFPKNEKLAEAEHTFQKTPPPDPQKLRAAPSSGGSISISVGGDNTGVIVGGDLHGSKMVMARDISGDGNVVGVNNEAEVTIGGIPASDEKPTVERFRQMVAEIHEVMSELTAQAEVLGQIDPAAAYTAAGVAQSINCVATALQAEPDNVDADSVVSQLSTAATLLETTLDLAKTLAEKADATGKAIRPLVERMTSLAAKIGLTAAWAAQLWPTG